MPGTGTAHLTASDFENLAGKFLAEVEPSWLGPRQLGQSAAREGRRVARERVAVRRR